MAMYEVGTVTGAASQARVTGATTKWSQVALGIQPGSILVVYRSGSADLYAIKSVDSDTQLTLTRNITTAFSGASYGIITAETASTSSFANQLASAFAFWRSVVEGWRIGKDGSSQFNNVIVRGRVEANSGIFKGTVQAESFIGDIATSASFNGFTVKGGGGPKTMNAWYQNRGYPMTITLNCTVRCNSYSGGIADQRNDFFVVLTFNINGVQSTRRVVVDMRDKAHGLVDVPQSFTVNIPASNDRIGISLTGASYGPQQSEVTVGNIVVTAFRSNNGSFGQ